MKKLLCSIIILAVAGFAYSELINPGFEDYDDMTGWGTWASGYDSGGGWFGAVSGYAYIDTTGNGHGGSQNFMTLDTTPMTVEGCSIFYRLDDAEHVPVIEGDWVKMGVWAKDIGGYGGSVLLEFAWLGQFGGYEKFDSFSFDVTGEWAYYSAWTQVPPPDAYPGGIFGIEPTWGINSPGSLIGIDDLEIVPEPMSIALLGFGALALRRRK